MNDKLTINKFSKELKSYLPSLSIDCVILGLIDNELNVLVLRWKETKSWGLPGGFIKKEESLDEAAHRILKRRTNLDITYLKQLHVFGQTNRRDILSIIFPFLMIIETIASNLIQFHYR